MKELPYFRWFPKDAETDEVYSSMSDEELGFYHRCLNFAWINDGIPADPSARAKALRRNRKQADARWTTLVASRFKPHEQRPGYLVNARQETERIHAEQKSIKATESANARYERSKSEDANAVHARASADSDSVLFLEKKQKPKEETKIFTGVGFEEFWTRWGELTKRRVGMSDAAQAWLSVVPQGQVAATMACLERYGASGEVLRGVVMNPSRWLFENAREGWKSDWQPPVNAAEMRSNALRRAIGDD